MKKLLVLFIAVSTLVGCSKDDPAPKIEMNQSEVKLKYDEDFNFKIENAAAVKWTSSDDFVGIIDASGKFEAHHIGEATVTGEFDGKTLTAKVIVEPYISDVVEPSISFGSTRERIKSLEKRTLKSEGTAGMIFTGKGNREKEVWYTFEDLKLTASLLTFKNSSTLADDLVKFYGERYEYLGLEEDIVIFGSKDGKYLVGITEFEEIGTGAMYINNNSEKANIRSAISTQQLRIEKSNLVTEISQYRSK